MDITTQEQLHAQWDSLAERVALLDQQFEDIALVRMELEMARERIVDELLMANLFAYGDTDDARELAMKIEDNMGEDSSLFYNSCLHLKWNVHKVESEDVADDTFGALAEDAR